MKTIITVMILSMCISLGAQTTKKAELTYMKTFEKAGMEGACLYEVTFTTGSGTIVCTDIFHGQYNEKLMKLFCDERKLTEQETERFNETGQVERTAKGSVGKKFKISYTEGDCISIEAAEAIQPQDTLLVQAQKEQKAFQTKNQCPNCPLEAAKSYLKNYLTKADQEILSEPNERKRSMLIEVKNYIKEAVALNKYTPYYFSGNRAVVVINHKMKGRAKNLAIQLKRVNNKWTAVGMDDSWTYCDGLKDEDMVTKTDAERMKLHVYVQNSLKGG